MSGPDFRCVAASDGSIADMDCIGWNDQSRMKESKGLEFLQRWLPLLEAG